MRETDFIVSKTDLMGRIVYCNQIFFEFSGYRESELIGKQHNIIRHPDMPRSVFKLLWDTIQQGEECWAYIKNMSRDGGFYWVLANVTPDRDAQGEVVGYYSVRRKPAHAALRTVENLYARMLVEERISSAAGALNAGTRVLIEHFGKTPYHQAVHLL
jgi:PAS domain S-box-containing protein